MRKLLSITLLPALVLALMLSGCATSAERKKASSEYNTEYVSHVVSHARRAGVTVIWVNPPRRKVEEQEQADR